MGADVRTTKGRTPQEMAELVRAHSDELVRYAFCLVGEVNAAEEAVLDAMAVYVTRRGSATLPITYLWRMVRSRCMDYLRHHRRHAPLAEAELVPTSNDVEQDAIQAERKRVLYRCIRSLPVDYGNVLYLRYLEDFSIEETARIMGKNVKQVYNLLSRAKVALKNALHKEGFDYDDL